MRHAGVAKVVNVGLAPMQPLRLLGIDVEADHREPGLFEQEGQREPEVAETDDAQRACLLWTRETKASNVVIAGASVTGSEREFCCDPAHASGVLGA